VDVGSIVFNILLAGAQVFKADAQKVRTAAEDIGTAAEKAAPKQEKLGKELDQTGEKAKRSKKPLDDTAKSTKDVGDEAEKAAPKIGKTTAEIERQRREALSASTTIGTSMLAVSAAIAVVGGLAVSKFADFEVATDRTSAAISASAEQSRDLSDAALQAGADSVYSASEAADAQTELAKAGLTVKDVLTGGLTGSLALAAAGELDVARAAEIAAITLKQFHLEGDQTTRVADTLAAGAGKAVGSVDDLANGLKFVGPVAQSMNVSLEESVGVLSLFAKNGIIGEQGGTAFRGMLSSLTSPSKLAAAEIERLQIKLYDANGAFLGVENAAGELSRAYTTMKDEQRDLSLGILFGNEQVTAARVLYQAGAEGVREMTTAVSEAGYAQKQASQLTDNLTGDIERLGGSIDTAFIQTGSGANDMLREIVQGLTFLTDAAGELPAPVLSAGAAITTGVIAVAALSGGAFIAIPRIVEMKNAMADLGISGRKVAIGAGVAGTAIGLYLYFVAAAISAQADMKATGDELRDSLDQQTGAFTEYSREIVAKKLQDTGAAAQAEKYGISLDTLTDAAFNNKDAVKELAAAQAEYMAGDPWRAFDTGVGDADRALEGLQANIRDAPGALADLKAATEGSASATTQSADAYMAANTEASELLGTLTELVAQINAANGVGQDAVSSNAAYQAALAGVKETIEQAKAGAEGFSTSMDENTEAGAANAEMFADMAAKSQAAADAQFALDNNSETYIANLNAGRQALVDQITALTGNADAAQAFADKVYAIPTEAEVDVIANTASALLTIDDFIAKMGQKSGVINFRAQLPDLNGTEVSGNGQMGTFADGGVVSYYAAGGVRENHVAQFARAGDMRVWAEPETGGEAYIPLAPSKRARSLAIWQETGRRLGVSAHAEGSVTTGTAPRASAAPRPLYLDSGEFLGMVRETAAGVTEAVIRDKSRGNR
jgi:TP901 family phage tail tape measure protein